MEATLDITSLLKKYGSVRSIPETELAAAGFVLRRAPDGTPFLHRRDAEDATDGLRRKLAHALNVPASLFTGRSLPFLGRLLLVLDEEVGRLFTDDEGKHQEGRLLDGRVLYEEPIFQSFDLMVCMLRAKARGELADLRQRHGEANDTLAELTRIGIDLPAWTKGVGERFMDSEEGVVATESDFLSRLTKDLRQSLEMFERLDEAKFKSCLKELGSHLACKSMLDEILEKSVLDRKAMHTCLSVSLKRLAGVKPDSRNELGVAQFHLKRALDSLKSGPSGSTGAKVFRALWSAKDPLDDLLIGNDAGCCIGVYGADDEFGDSPGKKVIPAMLFDPATQFIELWCGDERVGLALCFACYQDGEPVLVVNSIELTGRIEAHAKQLVELALGYAIDLAAAAGFKRVAMGNHSYNTGMSHGHESWLGQPLRHVEKFHQLTRRVHGDVFNSDEDEPNDGWKVYGVSEVVMPSPTSSRQRSRVSAWQEEGILTFAQAREICEVVIGPDELRALRTKLYGLNDRFENIHPWRWGECGRCGFRLDQLLRGIELVAGRRPVPGSKARVALVALDVYVDPTFGIESESQTTGSLVLRGEPKIGWDTVIVHLLPLDISPPGKLEAVCMNVLDAVPVLELLLESLGESGVYPGISWIECERDKVPFKYCFRGDQRGDWLCKPEESHNRLVSVEANTYDDDADSQHWTVRIPAGNL